MSTEITIMVHDIATDGLPDMENLIGRVAFIWDGAIVSDAHEALATKLDEELSDVANLLGKERVREIAAAVLSWLHSEGYRKPDSLSEVREALARSTTRSTPMTRTEHPLVGKTVCWTHGPNTLVGPATHYDEDDGELFIVPDGLIHGRYWVPLEALLKVVRDGDEHGWQTEFDQLWSEQEPYMDMLATSIQETGIHMPILIGTDGRVWDGHHRLAAAHKLGLETVPIEWAGDHDAE